MGDLGNKLGNLPTLAAKHINALLTSVLLSFMGSYGSTLHLEMPLSDLMKCFPVELLPENLTQQQAIINFFKNRDLVVLGNTEHDRIIIFGNLTMQYLLEPKIV